MKVLIINNESKHYSKDKSREKEYIYIISNGNMIIKEEIKVIVNDLICDRFRLYNEVEKFLHKYYSKNFVLINLIENGMI